MNNDDILQWAQEIQTILHKPEGGQKDWDRMETLIAKIVEAC